MGRCHPLPLLYQRPCAVYSPAANPDKRLTMTPSSGRPQTNKTVFIPPRGFYLCGRSVMIYKGERFMHITTYHIPAKRRHIDAATRLRRLSHVVAASTHVVRGCKLPRRPSARFSPHAESRRPAFSVWAVDSSCPYPSFFGSVCSVPAKAKKFFELLAAFLQRPKSFSRHLQRSCKHPSICFYPTNDMTQLAISTF